MSKNFVRVLLVLSLMLVVSGLTTAQDDARKVIVTGISMVGGDVPSIDPGLSETSQSIDVLNQLFVGLTAQDVTTAELADGVATYEATENEDGTATYTFTIQQGIPWVRYNPDSDAVEEVTDDSGATRYVTANDFAYGILRTLDPETASPYSYVLVPYIVGAGEYNSGEGAAEDVGITVVDDYTLQITAPSQTLFTPLIYGLWMARAVPQWLIEEYGDLWTEAENIATYGPFAVKDWSHDESLTIVKNPFWPGTEGVAQPKVDEVVFRFLDPQQQFAEYQAGNMDAIQVPVEEVERAKADPELSAQYVTGANPCTYYVGFDNTESPTDNVHLRRALSLAIDREAIVTNVTKRGEIPARWFVRPDVNAAPTLEDYPDLGISFDPEAAKEEFALALADLGLNDASELQLSLAYNDSSNHGSIMQAIQQMWADTLGLQVTLDPRDPSTYFASLSEDAPAAYRAGWCQDYPDANSYDFDVFFSGSSQNDTGFVNEEFDNLVEQARTSLDNEQRVELYAQAEDILVNQQAAIAPIYWYTLNLLVKPDVERSPSITGNEAYYNWDVNR